MDPQIAARQNRDPISLPKYTSKPKRYARVAS